MENLTTNTIERFDFNANTIEGACAYMLARAKQLLRFGYKLKHIEEKKWGISAYFDHNGEIYQSLYILLNYRGRGIFRENIQHRIITSKECGISDYLLKNNIEFTEVIIGFKEYDIISEVCGNQVAKRSGISYMNHIDEGLYILDKLNAMEITKSAYTLHPIVQSDELLFDNFNKLYNIDPLVAILATEYRSVANGYLSSRFVNESDILTDIQLSPLIQVNQMLIADKIQNRKDFELYHLETHPRSSELNHYFKNWMTRLNISEEFYQECVDYLT